MASSNETDKVGVSDVVFLYEKNSGKIRHTHYNAIVQSTIDTTMPSKDLIEEQALKIAKQRGLHTSKLAALHVAYKNLKHDFGTGYRVNVKTRTLVEQKFRNFSIPVKRPVKKRKKV